MAVWELDEVDGRLVVSGRFEPGIPVGTNPRDIAMSPDGTTVAVAALTGNTVSILDVATREERVRVELGAPANGLVIVGDTILVTTTSASTHHQPFAGPDTDGDGLPGDGTPNINFQDLQNEIAVLSAATGAVIARHTSDSICCRDYRDVDPRDDARFGDLLPPASRWIVGGALPEQIAVSNWADSPKVWVTYSGSDEFQAFDLDAASGELTAGPVFPSAGHNPHGVAVSGDKVVIAHRLSESLGIYDASTGELVAEAVVGDVTGGAFPATDAEIGELFNFVTSPFTIDGDQTCQHCHREGGNIDKAFSMPLTRYPGLGLRQTMAYRGMADSQPWFFEAAMDHTNFVPVMNEFARIENFCCSDYTLWPNGAPAGCAQDPPARCAEADNATSADGVTAMRDDASPFAHPRASPAATRDIFYLDAIERLIGRRQSYGDGLFFEDPITQRRQPLPLNFDGITPRTRSVSPAGHAAVAQPQRHRSRQRAAGSWSLRERRDWLRRLSPRADVLARHRRRRRTHGPRRLPPARRRRHQPRPLRLRASSTCSRPPPWTAAPRYAAKSSVRRIPSPVTTHGRCDLGSPPCAASGTARRACFTTARPRGCVRCCVPPVTPRSTTASAGSTSATPSRTRTGAPVSCPPANSTT